VLGRMPVGRKLSGESRRKLRVDEKTHQARRRTG
jgi:hypothetical protein